MIVAVAGTGTGVGKTHIACALVGALCDRGIRAAGWKPVESGVVAGAATDEALLRAVSCGPVPPTIRLAAPIAPNVAARREGIVIVADAIEQTLRAIDYAIVVLELAGGLFSPLTDTIDNATFLARVAPRVIVVAPDRLGVLHDVHATVRAATTVPLALSALVLSAPAVADDSTGANVGELRVTLPVACVPRAPIAELRRSAAIAELADHLRR
jgi:dethiobiotin synthetase